MPGPVPSIFRILYHYNLAKPCEGISIIIPILQRKKLRLRDIKLLVQDHHEVRVNKYSAVNIKKKKKKSFNQLSESHSVMSDSLQPH